jgi:hypothetical protein
LGIVCHAAAETSGWSARWQSSIWWIKTARCEDNEVEATMAEAEHVPTSLLSVVIQHLLADLRPEGRTTKLWPAS